uniref:Synaptobrevin, longin-like domain protein n=1 Tax=Tanacetum cinerariifolium TaxID=118510 RepID=A0A6L2J1I6_TANCI|nr:hypothetical protein [Tanacetum cinerariifolium]
MSLLFADTHNVVAILEKSDAAGGFEQIIDFLSGSYIHYALTLSPHIYISFIKQFWNSVSVKRSGDVTRLQALVDRKKIVISEAVIREILQLNDVEGVICLPNEEIFAGLAQIGYEKPSTKLTFYKAFFSSRWKFLIHTILQSLSAKRTSWNEFSIAMASAVICLSKVQRFNFSKYIFDSLVRNVNSSSKFYMVGKGFLGVETPLFEGMITDRQPVEEELGAEQVQVDAVAAAVVEDVAEDVDWDAAMDHVNQKSSSNPQYIKIYQGMKKRPQTESEARKNMMIYLKNTVGYKMDFFKGMTCAQIYPIFQARFDENIRFLFNSREEMEAEDQEVIKSINETPAHKAAKKRKLSEEVQEAEDLRKRLKVVEDEDDDVFVEATPLASKVHVVDYQIVLIYNKPRWTRCYMEKSKDCSWFGIGEKMEAADFMWCSYHHSFNGLAIPIG